MLTVKLTENVRSLLSFNPLSNKKDLLVLNQRMIQQ